MAWTDERVELLKKLWAEGLTASQIAARLGGVTRNAVVGKVHRLGLSGRATCPRRIPRPPPGPRPTQERPPATGSALAKLQRNASHTDAAAAPELVIPPDERRSILTLTAS